MTRIAIALSVLLAGCAPMSEMQCRSADWYRQGEDDGLRGNQARVAQYAHQCTTYGVKPAEQDYMAGWAAGYAEWARRVSGSKI